MNAKKASQEGNRGTLDEEAVTVTQEVMAKERMN